MKTPLNVLVIAGYGQDADQSQPHRDFIINSVEFGISRGIGSIFAIGGATNPDYPKRTEADATLRVLSEINFIELFFRPPVPIIVLRRGDTSADTLQAVKEFILRFNSDVEINELILACETSRSAGFLTDSLFVGLSQLAKRVVVYTDPLPETSKEFENQKKKLLIKILSHRYKFFHRIRYILQKRHQRRVAKIKRQLDKS